MERRYNAGLYLRLSASDTANPLRHESTSIENQRVLLMEYVRLRGWNAARVYADDGYSGGDFNRPAFHEMLRDAHAGLIDLILVKDLSRLGRDYLEVGRYTDEVFPALGCRFIALTDQIDSEGAADFLPFRSLLNDYYLKDLSRKIKSSLRAKANAGDYVGALAPYGYQKDPTRHRLMVDPYAAEVVRRIFALRLQRLGYAKIAAVLNREGILPPRSYRNANSSPQALTTDKWQDATVRHILHNEAYAGHSVKMKKGTLSYKNKRVINRPAGDWIRVEQTHPAIIPPTMWDKAQAVTADTYTPPQGKPRMPALFTGLMFCADCGSSLISRAERRRNPAQYIRAYHCGRRKRTGGVCSWHTVYETPLLHIIREDMIKRLEPAAFDAERLVRIAQIRLSETLLTGIKKELNRLEAALTEWDAQMARFYEDRLNGSTLDRFVSLSAKAEAERTNIQAEYDRLTAALTAAEQHLQDNVTWISEARRFLALDAPDRSTLTALIEKIEVGERENAGGKTWRTIQIHYRFTGEVFPNHSSP